MHENTYGLHRHNFKLLCCSFGGGVFLFLFKTTNDLPYRFSLCIDYRAKTLNLKNVKEVEYKYKTEDNCVS